MGAHLRPYGPRDALTTGCQNVTTVTSLLSRNYTQYCNFELLEHSLDSVTVTSFTECLESCTRHPCYGVSWDPSDNICWRKSKLVSVSSLNPKSNVTSALPFTSRIGQTMSEIVCPYPNLSKQKTGVGLEFTILCGANLEKNDMYNPEVDAFPWMHAETLEECMNSCANHHPLCTQITFDGDFEEAGWMNCWLKTSRSKPVSWTTFITHSALASVPSLQSVACRNNSLHTAGDGRVFKVSCDDQRVMSTTAIPPLGTYHEKSVEDCTTRCTHASSTCVAIAFDRGLQSGYLNCYLFSSIPPPVERHSNYTFLYLESLSSHFIPPPSKPAPSSRRPWIAGPIAGLCVAIAISIWYWSWHRKRELKRSNVPGKSSDRLHAPSEGQSGSRAFMETAAKIEVTSVFRRLRKMNPLD